MQNKFINITLNHKPHKQINLAYVINKAVYIDHTTLSGVNNCVTVILK